MIHYYIFIWEVNGNRETYVTWRTNQVFFDWQSQSHLLPVGRHSAEPSTTHGKANDQVRECSPVLHTAKLNNPWRVSTPQSS
jgi:hypothetical protein